MSRLSLSVFGAAALIAAASSAGGAQKVHANVGATVPVRTPEVHVARPPKMDRESPMGAAHEGMKGDKERIDETKRMEKREDRAADRVEKREDRTEKRAERGENRAERTVLRDAHEQSRYLLRGLQLSGAERRQVREIDRKYEAQIRALRKDEKSADKAGAETDAAFTQRVGALTAQERADIRAVLTPAQQARFDANISARASMKH